MSAGLPRVTIGIPLYNGCRFISDAVASVRADTFQDWEMLIYDDCSTDGGVNIVREIRDERIRLFSGHPNLGLVHARNWIVRESRGEFIAWLDQDDFNLGNRLAKQVAVLDAHPSVSLLCSWTDIQIEDALGVHARRTQRRPTDATDIRSEMLFTNPIACNTVMMRKASFERRDLYFREEFGNSLDYDLWSRATDGLEVKGLKESLATYRIHANQASKGSELLAMNAHALEIQLQLMARTLHIHVTPEEEKSHWAITHPSTATLEGLSIPDVVAWLAKIRSGNLNTLAFEPQALDASLSLRLVRVIRSHPQVSRVQRGKKFVRACRSIGLSPLPVLRSFHLASQRQISRL